MWFSYKFLNSKFLVVDFKWYFVMNVVDVLFMLAINYLRVDLNTKIAMVIGVKLNRKKLQLGLRNLWVVWESGIRKTGKGPWVGTHTTQALFHFSYNVLHKNYIKCIILEFRIIELCMYVLVRAYTGVTGGGILRLFSKKLNKLRNIWSVFKFSIKSSM